MIHGQQNIKHLFMSHSSMCVSMLTTIASSVPCVVSFMLFCIEVTVLPIIHCCVIPVIVINSYMIPLFLWHLAYRSCVFDVAVSFKMSLSIDDINQCVGEYKVARKVEKIVGLIRSVSNR
jgi:hypothetical protein